MTKATRIILIIGLLLVLLAGLFPPGQVVHKQTVRAHAGWGTTKTHTWYTDGRVFLLSHPLRLVYCDRLMVEWGFIAAGTAIAFLIAYRRRPWR